MNPETAEKVIQFLKTWDHASTCHQTGKLEQFLHDLFITGRAAMPDGEIVDLFPQKHEAFPSDPLAIALKRRP